jgi:hypothetical protein
MLHHIVLFKFKPTTTESEVDRLEALLEDLPNRIVEIQTLEFGRDVLHTERSYDFALVSGFPNLDCLRRYQAHPAHLEVLAHLKPLCEDIRAVDFETRLKTPDEGA